MLWACATQLFVLAVRMLLGQPAQAHPISDVCFLEQRHTGTAIPATSFQLLKCDSISCKALLHLLAVPSCPRHDSPTPVHTTSDALDMDSLPGSVGGTELARAPHKALVHGAFVRAASMHRMSGAHATPNAHLSSACTARVHLATVFASS